MLDAKLAAMEAFLAMLNLAAVNPVKAMKLAGGIIEVCAEEERRHRRPLVVTELPGPVSEAAAPRSPDHSGPRAPGSPEADREGSDLPCEAAEAHDS